MGMLDEFEASYEKVARSLRILSRADDLLAELVPEETPATRDADDSAEEPSPSAAGDRSHRRQRP
jgi:hypothetical protein